MERFYQVIALYVVRAKFARATSAVPDAAELDIKTIGPRFICEAAASWFRLNG
jgi:hypothetical protein